MSEAELLTFADYSLHFGNGVTLPFGSRQYGYELRRGVWYAPRPRARHARTPRHTPCHTPRHTPAPPELAPMGASALAPPTAPLPRAPLQVPRHL